MQFSRTLAPDTSKGPGLIAFMQQNNWRKITILSVTENIWFETRLGLAKQMVAAGITVLKPAAFEPGDVKDAMLSEVTRSGIRIVLVLSYGADTNTIAAHARHAGMLSPGWAWLVANDEGMASGDMQSWLYLRSVLASGAMQAFAMQVSDYSRSNFNIMVSPDSVDLTHSAKLHAAVMLYAHAATKLISEGGDLRDGEAVTAAVRNTSFTGVGDSVVALDRNGDRIESYEVMNYVLKEGGVMSSVAVGMFDSVVQQYTAYERPVVWPGNTMEVPTDYVSGETQCMDCHRSPFCITGFDRMPSSLAPLSLAVSVSPPTSLTH